MAIDYFSNFPEIVYDNQLVKNILLRAALREATRTATDVTLPLTIEYGERTDMIAHDLYKNSGYDWLVKFSAGVIDPYYDWPLTDTDFNKFIILKYNSIASAQNTILYYTHNTQDVQINPTTYNLLSPGEKSNYTSVSAYDYEYTENENKTISSMISPQFAQTIDNELEKKLHG